MATEFVRAKDPDTGHEVTVPKRFAKAYDMEVVDKPAVNANGRPLPGKPKVNLEKADGDADNKATTDGESSAGGAGTGATVGGSATTTSGQTAGKAGNR